MSSIGQPHYRKLRSIIPTLWASALLVAVGGVVLLPSPSAVALSGAPLGPLSKLPQPIPTQPPPPGGRLAWRTVPSPNVGIGVNVLTAVAGSCDNDTWAAGFSDAVPSGGNPLMLHWEGHRWERVPSPRAGTGLNYIVGLNAFSGKDVWATGSYYQGANQYTLAEHWNGLVWELVPSPNAGVNGNNAFNGMASSGPNDIWAVGDYNDSAHSNQTLIEHWDGHAWTIVPSPNQPGFNALYPAAAFSPTDAWVAGYYIAPGSANQTPLLLHWDGQTWRIVANPPTPPDATKVRFNGMGGRNGKDIWMVGSYRSNGSYHSLTEHWNGDAWTYQAPTLAVADEEISPASDPSAYSELYSVAVGPHGEVWAAGAWSTHLRPEDEVANPELLHTPGIRTLLLRWNGQTWRRVTSETPGQAGEFLALAPHAALPWAVGTYLNQEPAQTLIEQAHRR